ncbi:MAG: phospho-sugar mutase [Bacteroidota bacterium]|jgi:phosphoglucomutase|nr:phospho-sugar mutase [Chitinophagaceae bacterium]
MEQAIALKVDQWLNGNYDEATKSEIRRLQTEQPNELADAFYKNLEFGTGGLRGVMGVGTNRINQYTVGMATQGFANYLIKMFPQQQLRVAVAHDSRNNSRHFAEITANVMAANGIQVFLFEALRPTPELSFTIRHKACHGGVVCTASHNPKEYNGYKAYFNDGGQLVPPHDKNVIVEVEKIASVDDVKWKGGEQNVHLIGEEMDKAYVDMVKSLSVYPDVIKKQKDLKIVYTPIHGTGITMVPRVLSAYGFENIVLVDEQIEPNGNFPTVVYPNPEESEAMSLGLKKAAEMDADILLGTDPDADRVGIGVKDHHGNWVLMNGNQTAVLAFNYMIEARKQKGIAKENDMVVKTIVTTDMIDIIASKNNINCYSVLTGFKWIAELIKSKESTENYVIGGEESYGLMIGDQLRDKDAVSAVAILCEMAAYEKEAGKTLFSKLIELYQSYGLFREHLISITKKGRDGQAQIAAMMEKYRSAPPSTLGGVKVIGLYDYEKREAKDLNNGQVCGIDLPKSNVLQFVLEDGSKVSARPSGTEPKIKFYFSVQEKFEKSDNFDHAWKLAGDKIQAIIQDLELN